MAGSFAELVAEASRASRKRINRIGTCMMSARTGARIAIMLVTVLAVVASVRAAVMKNVSIRVDDDQTVTLTTAALRVGTALSHAGIQLFEGDVVTPSVDSPLRRGSEIVIQRAFPVQISADGKLLQVRTIGDTVEKLLEQAGIQLDQDDKVQPARDAFISQETVINVTRVTVEYITVDEVIPFKTERRSDPSLEKGKTRVARQGANGTLRKKIKQTYENGKLVAKATVSSEVVKAPVNAIINVGTRIIPRVVQTSGGKLLQYTEVKTVLATAYTPADGDGRGITYTGIPARKGVIAVDPKVIPLGTRVYIPEYGEAIAADTGSAIKGLRVDLCYESRQEALQFGRRPVKVYILARQ